MFISIQNAKGLQELEDHLKKIFATLFFCELANKIIF